MTPSSTYVTESNAADETSGAQSHEDNVVLTAKSSNNDTGKVTFSGAPSSTFWHFADFGTHGQFLRTETLPTSQVNAFSQVVVSICELDSNGNPFIGSAVMQVYNVAAHQDGRIIVRGLVNWGSDLNVRLNYIIVN